MIQVMDKDNERNANLAPKILNDTIKACGGTTNAQGGRIVGEVDIGKQGLRDGFRSLSQTGC